MWEDEEDHHVVLISALEHYEYCPRQCGLIHIDQSFAENIYTVQGNAEHERVDQHMLRTEKAIPVERAMILWSKQYGLFGKADVVEFHDNIPYPVEYKRGKRREWVEETIQLCAQALCLEEMFAVQIHEGAIYYCASHERRVVTFNPTLRRQTEDTIIAVRTMLKTMQLPPGVHDKRCRHCSLRSICAPEVLIWSTHLERYSSQLFTLGDEVEG